MIRVEVEARVYLMQDLPWTSDSVIRLRALCLPRARIAQNVKLRLGTGPIRKSLLISFWVGQFGPNKCPAMQRSAASRIDAAGLAERPYLAVTSKVGKRPDLDSEFRRACIRWESWDGNGGWQFQVAWRSTPVCRAADGQTFYARLVSWHIIHWSRSLCP